MVKIVSLNFVRTLFDQCFPFERPVGCEHKDDRLQPSKTKMSARYLLMAMTWTWTKNHESFRMTQSKLAADAYNASVITQLFDSIYLALYVCVC